MYHVVLYCLNQLNEFQINNTNIESKYIETKQCMMLVTTTCSLVNLHLTVRKRVCNT